MTTKANTKNDMSGIYIAFSTSSELKSICKQRNYKTHVNNQHTKVGIAKSFNSRGKGYFKSFDGDVEFNPIVKVPAELLKEVEKDILSAVCEEFTKVGTAREWFDTTDRARMEAIVIETLESVGCPFERI